MRAYRRALEEADIAVEPSSTAYGDWSVQSGYTLGQDLLGRPIRPTALFVLSEIMAAGTQQGALDLGLRVPDDLAIVTIEGSPPAVAELIYRRAQFRPPLRLPLPVPRARGRPDRGDNPLLLGQVRLFLVLGTLAGLQSFQLQVVISNPPRGPGWQTTVQALDMYMQAFNNGHFGRAAAIGMLLFLLAAVLTAINFRFVRSSVLEGAN